VQSKFSAETEIRRDEEGPPPDSIAIFEELVHDMGSQESRDTGNLRTDKQKHVAKGVWRYAREQAVETFGTRFSKLEVGTCTTTHSELYTAQESKPITSGPGHAI